MSRRSWLFTPREIDRLIKCAKRQDLQNYRIDIATDGKLSLIVGEATKTSDVEDIELDNWLAKHADQTERD